MLLAPDEDLNHLTPINDKYRRKVNQKPTFKEGSTIDAFYKSETEVQINYPRFDDDGLILYYTITISDLEGNENIKYELFRLLNFIQILIKFLKNYLLYFLTLEI